MNELTAVFIDFRKEGSAHKPADSAVRDCAEYRIALVRYAAFRTERPTVPTFIMEVTGATQEEVDAAKEGITAKAKVIAQKREKHKKKVSVAERTAE